MEELKVCDLYRNYRKKNVQPMRPYVEGEDMTGISVNKEDTPELGGMIAINPKNPEDKWYVAKEFFNDNYELAPATAGKGLDVGKLSQVLVDHEMRLHAKAHGQSYHQSIGLKEGMCNCSYCLHAKAQAKSISAFLRGEK